MSAPISDIVQVVITQETQAVQQASFSIPAIFGTSNRFAASATTMGTTTNGSNVVTGLVSTTGISQFQQITGTNIPPDTTVLAIQGNKLTLSNPATGSGTVSLTFTDWIRAYTSLLGMVSDGFQTTDQEYIEASELLEQSLQPPIFYVGRVSASVAQVDTLQVNTLNTSHLYEFTLNGELVSYQATSGNAQQDILNGLLSDIDVVFATPPVTGLVTGTGGSALLTLTAAQPGEGQVYTNVDTDLTHALVTPNHTMVSDIQQCQLQNDLWYGVLLCSQHAWDIEQVAAYIETQVKLFGADTNDQDVLTSSNTDVASVLKGKSYKRTFLLYSGTPNDAAAAAWMGGQLPQIPGASTWKFKTLVGITPDNLTPTQRTTCIGIPGEPGKNCNIYETVGGVNITEEGFTSGGQFIDVTVGIDWLQSTMQANVFSILVNTPKVPYTDQGISLIVNAVRQTLQQGVVNGLIDGQSPIVVSAPTVNQIPPNDRALRLLPDVSFSCRLAGAFHFIQIVGVVTV